jgi:hypothetical protein
MLKAANTATGSHNRRRKKINKRLILNRDPHSFIRNFVPSGFLALGQPRRGNLIRKYNNKRAVAAARSS